MAEATVATPNGAYMRQQSHWAPCVALMGGTLEMRAQGTTYLPQFPKETSDRYTTRLDEAVLYEAFPYAVQTLAGRPFGEPVQLGDGAADYFASFARNVDMAGTDITTFASRLLQDMLVYGRGHIMVDYPDTTALEGELGRPLTREDEIANGIRAYWVRVSPEEIIGWDGTQTVGGEQITRMRLAQTRTMRDATGYGEITRKIITEWTQTDITEYVQGDHNEWVPMGPPRPNTLGIVPLVTIYAQRDGLLDARPPLERLAWLNISHWQKSSDQDQIEKMARIPMLFLRGFAEEEAQSIEVGPFRMIGTRNDQADARVLETNGQAVKVGREGLRDLERQMAALAMAPMERKPGNITATEMAISAGQEISDLEAYTLKMEVALTRALSIAAAWDNLADVEVPEVNISQDFGFTPNMQTELQELREDFRMGLLSRRQYLWERQRRGLYSEDMDIDQVLDDAVSEAGAELMAPPEPGQQG